MESSPINCQSSNQKQQVLQSNAGVSLADAKRLFLLGNEIAVISFFYNENGELDGDGKSYTLIKDSWDDLLEYVMSLSDFTLRIMHVSDYSGAELTH